MIPAPLRVVLDANVLFPFTLRDTLLRAAAMGMYQVYWSELILDEVTRNLVKAGKMDQTKAARLVATMSNAFPEATVEGYEDLIASMANDEKDRHVVAAAVKAAAQVIVTNNLADFDPLPGGVEARAPDMFLLELFDLAPMEMVELLEQQAGALKRPPVSLNHLLVGLAKTAPQFVRAVRLEAGLQGPSG